LLFALEIFFEIPCPNGTPSCLRLQHQGSGQQGFSRPTTLAGQHVKVRSIPAEVEQADAIDIKRSGGNRNGAVKKFIYRVPFFNPSKSLELSQASLT